MRLLPEEKVFATWCTSCREDEMDESGEKEAQIAESIPCGQILYRSCKNTEFIVFTTSNTNGSLKLWDNEFLDG